MFEIQSKAQKSNDDSSVLNRKEECMYQCRRLVLILCLTVICHTASLLALAPQLITAQGKLTQTGGADFTDGIYVLTFAIYDSPVGGAAVWTETNQAVAVSNG